MLDLLIRHARVADGTGRAVFRGHVGVKDGRIVHVGREDPGAAARVIEADGLVVAPGFIDPHTHMDAQVVWDRQLSPSCWHGVTSAIVGNCGVGLMPVRETTREFLLRDLVNVEGIDYEVLQAGVQWNWNTPGEYFAHVEKDGLGVNVGAMIPLTPLRHYVMGDASFDRGANADELGEADGRGVRGGAGRRRVRVLDDLLANHRGYGGRPLACRNASRDELRSLCNVLRGQGKGVVAVALDSLRQGVQFINEADVAMLRFLVEESARPVYVPADGRDDRRSRVPHQAARSPRRPRGQGRAAGLADADRLHADDAQAVQVLGVRELAAGAQRHRRRAAQVYADPEFRARAKAEQVGHIRKIPWERVRVAGAVRPDLAARYNDRTIGMIAEVEHKHPLDAFLDLTLEDDLRTLYQFESANLDARRRPHAAAGAALHARHLRRGRARRPGVDLRYPTVLLGDWVRESGALTLEFAVWKLTGHPASVFGIANRGRLAPGYHADITLFDPKTIGSDPPVSLTICPPGAGA